MTHQCTGDSPESLKNTLTTLGDKWTALIVRILHEGEQRYSQLETKLDGISPRTLSQRLDMLTEQKIIKNVSDQGKHPLYSLTKKGEDLDDVLHQMAAWGKKYNCN